MRKKKKKKQKPFKLLLAILVVIIAIFLFNSYMHPTLFTDSLLKATTEIDAKNYDMDQSITDSDKIKKIYHVLESAKYTRIFGNGKSSDGTYSLSIRANNQATNILISKDVLTYGSIQYKVDRDLRSPLNKAIFVE